MPHPYDVDPINTRPPLVTAAIMLTLTIILLCDPYLNYRDPDEVKNAPPLPEISRETTHLQLYLRSGAVQNMSPDELARFAEAYNIEPKEKLRSLTPQEARKWLQDLDEERMHLEARQPVHPYTLHLGRGLKPWQWLTSKFLHARIAEFFVTIAALWFLGFTLEGALGWWPFLLLYLVLVPTTSAIEQVLYLDAPKMENLFTASAAPVLLCLAGVTIAVRPGHGVRFFYIPGWWRTILRDEDPIYFGTFPIALLCIFFVVAYRFLALFFPVANVPPPGALYLLWPIIGFLLGLVLIHLPNLDLDEKDLVSLLRRLIRR